VSYRSADGEEIAATDPDALPPAPAQLLSHRRRARKALSPAQLRSAEREKRALSLRLGGANFADIAAQLGYATPSGAYRAVERALERWGAEDAAHLRRIEFARMDVMTEKLWPLIESGDQDAMALYLKLADRRAKMAGLDAPKRTEITAPNGPVVAVERVEHTLEYQALVAQVMHDNGGTLPGVTVIDVETQEAAG